MRWRRSYHRDCNGSGCQLRVWEKNSGVWSWAVYSKRIGIRNMSGEAASEMEAMARAQEAEAKAISLLDHSSQSGGESDG